MLNTFNTFTQFIPSFIDEKGFPELEQYLKEASLWIQAQLTGVTTFEASSTYTDLLHHCQAVEAYKGFLSAIPQQDLLLTNAGFAVTSNQHQAPASKERVAALIASTAKQLDEAIDNLLDYLQASTFLHDDWKGSQVFANLSDTYILGCRLFKQYGAYTGGAMDFFTLKPKMHQVIALDIEPIISAALSDQIIEQLRDDDLTAPNKAILKPLRLAFAAFVLDNRPTGERLMAQVRSILMRSPEDYPSFMDSSIYQGAIGGSGYQNSEDSPVFVAGA